MTFVTSQSLSHLNSTSYTEVLIDPPFELYSLSECKKVKYGFLSKLIEFAVGL